MDIRKHLGSKIRFYRERAALSQEQLGFDVGISKQTVYRIENGLGWPEYENVVAMAMRLKVQPEDFFRGIDEASPVELGPLEALRIVEAALRAPASAPGSPALGHLPPKILEYLAQIKDPSDLALIEEDLEIFATEKIPQMKPAEAKDPAETPPKTVKKLGE